MKYYLRHSYLENEESQMIEFKGHRAFAPEDVNKLNCVGGQATRRDISRHACGMLNTPNGRNTITTKYLKNLQNVYVILIICIARHVLFFCLCYQNVKQLLLFL